MALLTRLTALAHLTWLPWAAQPTTGPLTTPLVELKTADGVFLVTVDGNYLGTEN